MNLSEFLNKLNEKQGVPEHPKAAAAKRKKTESEHFGKENVKAVHKTQEKMKGVKGIDNPFALARWQKYGKFADEREKARKK